MKHTIAKLESMLDILMKTWFKSEKEIHILVVFPVVVFFIVLARWHAGTS